MAKYEKVEVIAKAKELARMMSETEEVDFFKRAEKQINDNKKISQLIEDIKLKQKEAVNLQHFGKQGALKQVEEQINKMTDEIEQTPIVQEFKQSQTEVNNLLQLVSTTISNTVTEEIIKTSDTGGETSSNLTGSSDKKIL
ncbi:MAG TPA: YlbF family regulator [Bacillales bacterium]|nr:YlbF family regulator [Bacillales bacterium]